MTKTKQLWLGWMTFLYNGFQLASGLLVGEVGGFGRLVNPDRLPSLDYEHGWYLAILALYAALAGLGVYLILAAKEPADMSGKRRS